MSRGHERHRSFGGRPHHSRSRASAPAHPRLWSPPNTTHYLMWVRSSLAVLGWAVRSAAEGRGRRADASAVPVSFRARPPKHEVTNRRATRLPGHFST